MGEKKKKGRKKVVWGGRDDGTDEEAAVALCSVRRTELWDLHGDACEQENCLFLPTYLS